MKELFKQPEYLKPKINNIIYWVHLIVDVVIVYLLVNWKNPENNYLLWLIYLGISDIVSHSLLSLD